MIRIRQLRQRYILVDPPRVVGSQLSKSGSWISHSDIYLFLRIRVFFSLLWFYGVEECQSGEDSSQYWYLRFSFPSPLEHVCREMGPEESQANTESDPYSITLPNGEQLHMVPVPMDLEVGSVKGMNG